MLKRRLTPDIFETLLRNKLVPDRETIKDKFMNKVKKKIVKQTLDKIFTSRAFFVIFSILAAVTLWVYISYSENPDITEYYSGIPIEFVGTDSLQDKNLIVTGSDVSQVSLRLAGKRIDMTKLKKDNISIVVDVSRVTDPERIS